MSFKIKPEDVGQKLQDACWIHAKGEGASQRWSISEIINAAIEAGLVSPPVYTVRDNQGNLLDDEVYGLWANPDAAESQHKEDYTAEHWKGQTE